MRGTRDLLRRRTYLVRRRAELLAHIQNTFTQYNVASRNGTGRDRLKDGDPAAHFTDESVQYMLRADTRVVEHLDETIVKLESYLIRHAKIDDPIRFQLLKTIPGVGPVLAMVILYETQDIERFDHLGQFVSRAHTRSVGRATRGVRARVGGEEARHRRSQNRQRALEVGVRRSGRPDDSQHRRGEGVHAEDDAAAREGASGGAAGGEDRSGRLLDDAA
jgi:transposase